MHLFSLKKNYSKIVDPLTVDLHSHLIPGIDDGAQTEEESLQLIQGLLDLGYKKVITTPHIHKSIYANTSETIEAGLQKLQSACFLKGLNIELKAAAEYFFDNYFFECIENKNLLTFGNQYVLFELPMNMVPVMVDSMIENMHSKGYKPVLAHPERYHYFHDKSMAAYKRLKDQDVYFQVNLMSLTGYYNNDVKRAAQELIRKELIDFAGTDLHRQKQIALIHSVKQDKFYKFLIDSEKLQNQLI
ncbi:MAG: capsular biosynthesis protein [Chitinophagales bacterium]|nr:capsular biosynthesis protein [Chitinophagales bacterium]